MDSSPLFFNQGWPKSGRGGGGKAQKRAGSPLFVPEVRVTPFTPLPRKTPRSIYRLLATCVSRRTGSTTESRYKIITGCSYIAGISQVTFIQICTHGSITSQTFRTRTTSKTYYFIMIEDCKSDV